jgi:hypothetical protein
MLQLDEEIQVGDEAYNFVTQEWFEITLPDLTPKVTQSHAPLRRKVEPVPVNAAASSYTYICGFNNHILGTSDHAAIYHGEGNTILNSPWTQLYHSHHVIVEGGEKMALHSLSYVHVTPDGHRPLNESDWEALTKRVRGIE